MEKKPKKAAKTRKKAPKSKPFTEKLDEKVAKLEEELNKKNQPAMRSVVGLSFTDYEEYKILGGDGKHDPWILRNMGEKIPKNWTPRLTTVPHTVRLNKQGPPTVKPFTAADYKKVGGYGYDDEPDIFTGAIKPQPYKKKIIWPKYYQNPYQYQDYVYLQDIYANTICGRIFDTVGFFALANGVKPKLKVRNEDAYDNDEAKRKALEEHKWMVETMEEIERNVSTSSNPTAFGDPADVDAEYPLGPISTAESPETPSYDTSLQKKWFAAFIMEMMFGREIVVPRIDEDDNEVTVQEDGTEETYRNIPKIMMVIHPRDIGFNYVDYMTHRLLGVQLNNSNWILRPDEMIFWENKPDNPVYGSKFYGMAEAQSMMGSARTLRRIIEVDFPLIAKTRWSGMYWLVFKRKGEQVGTSDAELARILSNVELNGINATLEDEPKDDFMLHKIDLDPKISELLQTVKDLIIYMMSQVGMPQGLLYGEDSLNRDTFKSKVASWTKGTLKRYREPFLETITQQWYRRLCKTLAAQSKKWEEALKEFEIIATVEEFKLDDRETLIRTLMELENITGAWKDEARADYLEMEDLQQRVDPEKGPEDLPPMPNRSRGYNVTDRSTGNEFGVSRANE